MLVLHSIMLHTCNIVQSKFSNSRAQPLDDGQMIQAQEMPSVLHPHQSNQDSSAIASRYKITQFLDLISFNIGIHTTTYSHVQFSFILFFLQASVSRGQSTPTPYSRSDST